MSREVSEEKAKKNERSKDKDIQRLSNFMVQDIPVKSLYLERP
jgi:hypothetical protein